MRHCYICDANIPGAAARRTVRTGSSTRVSVGRRVSTSTGERQGLRTVCQTCADEIDTANQRAASSAAFGRKILGFGGLAIVGLIIYANSNGGRDLHAPSTDAFITPAQAAPAEAPAMAPRPPVRVGQANGGMPTVSYPTARPDSAPVVTAMNSVPLQPAATNDIAIRPPVSWRHVTAEGVRWSLRHIGGGSLLLIDLGGEQVANVNVAPAFEALDLPSMNMRVDHVRTTITQSFAPRTANYSFERDGSLRILP